MQIFEFDFSKFSCVKEKLSSACVSSFVLYQHHILKVFSFLSSLWHETSGINIFPKYSH